MKTQATARPWSINQLSIFSEDGSCVCRIAGASDDEQSKADAALIVQAVNQFDALNAVAEIAEKFCKTTYVLGMGDTVDKQRADLYKALSTLETLRNNH